MEWLLVTALVAAAVVVLLAAGAAGVAALLSGDVSDLGGRVAVVLSGGNIDSHVLAGILSERNGGPA